MQIAPNKISPNQPFDLFYLIRNNTDSSTYYVRAKIYDLYTGDLLDTVSLSATSTNPRLFTARVQAPPDPGSFGRNIVAIATVYTDSAYTTKSDIYFEDNEQYFLIKSEPLQLGGGMIDWPRLEERLGEIVEKKLEAQPKADPVPFDALFGAIGALQREINRIPKDDPEFDLTPAVKAIASLKDELRTFATIKTQLLGVKEAAQVNIEGMQNAIETLAQAGEDLKTAFEAALTRMESNQKEMLQKMEGEMLSKLEAAAKDIMSRQEFTIPISDIVRTNPKEEPIDVTALFKR